MMDQEKNSFGCIVMLLLIGMMFCGWAIGSTDEYEQDYHRARDIHYVECWLCW